MTPAQTFGGLLKRRLAADPGRPLITYYDDGRASGGPSGGSGPERTELSVATYGNWVAKTASYLAEEHDLALGDRILLDLPAHWLGPVFAGAAWWLGLVVVHPDDETRDADLVVCGPDGVLAWAGSGTTVVATALHPLGLRFSEPLPAGFHDFGAEVWSQPDSFEPWESVSAYDEAAPGLTQAELWATSSAGLPDGARVLSTANPCSAAGRACFAGPFAAGGSLVLVRPRDATTPARLDEIAAAEHATRL